jgi:hypothetical protein
MSRWGVGEHEGGRPSVRSGTETAEWQAGEGKSDAGKKGGREGIMRRNNKGGRQLSIDKREAVGGPSGQAR